MSNIMFFSIPAHGHTNPTIRVVAELVEKGHRVRYYSFEEFREKIEGAGAEFVDCAPYQPPAPEDLDEKVGKDFALLIEMVVDTTVKMDGMMAKEIEDFKPDCIVADSVCFWGKLFAQRYHIPFVCSTTTMAFNKYTAKLMKQGFSEMITMFKGMHRINEKMEVLKNHGYQVDNFISIIQNDNETNTVVYTTKMFQPMVDTFSEKYRFIGPSIPKEAESYPVERALAEKKQIYISLGTVLNKNITFYEECVEALKDMDCRVIISAGKDTDISTMKKVPENFDIQPYVNQLQVLSATDVFITHCGMNSVNESLYMGVPMVLFPQHSEEAAVATRVEQLKAGFRLKKDNAKHIKKAVSEVLGNTEYKENARKLMSDFRKSGGAKEAAAFIETVMQR